MLLDGDGFDHYGGSITTMVNSGVMADHTNASLNSSIVRTGTHSLALSNSGGVTTAFWRRVIPSAPKTVIGVGFGLYLDSLPSVSNRRGINFRDNNNANIASFGFLSTGQISVWRGAVGGTLLGTSTLPILTGGSWNFVEFKIGANSSTGTTGCRVNNVEVDGLMLTGQNTAGTANAIAQIVFGDNTTASAGAVAYIDDYMVWDSLGTYNNDWVGDQQLFWRPPTADHPTLPQEFVPSTGTTLWDLIDEASPSAADYIRALQANKQAAFDFADLPSDITDVIAAIPYLYAKKLNAGTCTVNTGMLSNGVVGDGLWLASTPDIQITTLDTMWRTVLETNPDTGLPFTPAEMNAAYLYLDRTA